MGWFDIFKSKKLKELNDELNLCMMQRVEGRNQIQKLQILNASLRRQNEILRRDIAHLMSQKQPRDPKTGRMLPKDKK